MKHSICFFLTSCTPKKKIDRQHILKQIELAHFSLNAKRMVEILKSANVKFLTEEDIADIKCNILHRASNDQFSKELWKWKAQQLL